MPTIRAKTGSHAGQSFEIGDAPLIVGRDDRAEIQVLDQGVSRRHAEIFRLGEMFFIRDLDSRNGTFVNEERIKEELLRDQDEIRIGGTVFVFEDKIAAGLGAQSGAFLGPIAPGRRVRVAPGAEATTTLRLDLAASRDLLEPAPLGGAPSPAGGPQPPSGTLGVGAHDLAEELAAIEAAEARARAAEAGGGLAARLRDAKQDLETLHEVTGLLAGAKEPQQVVQQVVEIAGAAVRADHACLFVRKEGAKELELAATFEAADALAGAEPGSGSGSGSPVISARVIQEVVRTSRPLLSGEGAVAPASASRSAEARPRAVICAPLVAMDKVLGVLYCAARDDASRFSEDDLGLVTAIAAQTGLALQALLAAQKSERTFLGAVRALIHALEMRDPTYEGHSERVATYCAAIAKALGLGRAESRRIQLAALLHNIGKIALPQASEAGAAAVGEESSRGDVLARRTEFTEKLIRKMEGLEFLLPVIRHYNERMDGTGFPDGLPGDKIPLAARILAVADLLDSYCTRGEAPRYQKLALKEALMRLRSLAPQKLDGRVVDALLIAHRGGYLLTPEDRLA